MNEIYNLKQDKFETESPSDQLTLLQNTNKRIRRKNEILNGFIFFIGVFGFLTVFMLPRDFVYSRTSLENSFSNHSNKLASSSLPIIQEKKSEPIIDWEKHFLINGFLEAGEPLQFELNSYQVNSEVGYTIQFGNGDAKEINNKITSYKYPVSGNYELKVIANYHGEMKVIHQKKIFIDEAIYVSSRAFVEAD